MQTTGIPPQDIAYQHDSLYYADNLRAAIFQRDKYTCKICGKSALEHENVYLHVHHALYGKKRHLIPYRKVLPLVLKVIHLKIIPKMENYGD